MKPFKYDWVQVFPVLTHDVWEIIWYRKVRFQLRKMPDGRYHILINKLKKIRTLEVDGLDMVTACRDCTVKYGQVIKKKKGRLPTFYYCPMCYK